MLLRPDPRPSIDIELMQATNQFVYGVELSKRNGSAKTWMEIFERMNGKINTALVELEDEFRELLGEKANKANSADAKSRRAD